MLPPDYCKAKPSIRSRIAVPCDRQSGGQDSLFTVFETKLARVTTHNANEQRNASGLVSSDVDVATIRCFPNAFSCCRLSSSQRLSASPICGRAVRPEGMHLRTAVAALLRSRQNPGRVERVLEQQCWTCPSQSDRRYPVVGARNPAWCQTKPIGTE
jgi:hypothetical protein